MQSVSDLHPSGIGVERVPHHAVLAGAGAGLQAPPQYRPEVQETPHRVPSQVAVPFAGGVGQAEHEVPQELVLVLERH